MQKQKENLSASMPKLIMAVSLIVCIGALLGAVGYFMMNKTVKVSQPKDSVALKPETADQIIDETADWKTYRNEEYGFEFKYPKDWTTENFKTVSKLVSIGLNKAGYNRKPGTDMPNSVNFYLYKSIAELDSEKINPVSLKDYLDKCSALSDPVYKNVISKKIGSLDGYEVDAGPNQFGGGKYFLTELPNKQVVRFWLFNERIDQEIFNQILSTFKFTKQ